MARSTPADGTAQQRSESVQHASLLAARRGAVAHGLSLLAELGRGEGGDASFLARQDAARSLVGVHVWPRPDKAGHEFAMVFELDVSLPGPSSTCPICGRAIDGWTRYCACGTDVSGVARASTRDAQRAQLERVRDAARVDYQILGSLNYSAGGGVVYFGRHLVRDEIVPLRVYEGESGGPITLAAAAALMPIGETSPHSGPVSFSSSDLLAAPPHSPAATPRLSGPGSELMRAQLPPAPGEPVAVPKVCPQCGQEYHTDSRYCPNDGSPLRPKDADDPLVGRVIADRYHVLKRLGEGGMGRVYLAEHVKMHRQCAIKVMNAALVNDTASAARFAREASSAARILHPNVAAVFDYGEANDIVYLVMEYVDGEPLTALIEREGRLAPHRALNFARQIVDGLAAAHELGLVHRDLKPDNILVARGAGGREVVKIVDFGIAKATNEGSQEGLTRTGYVVGTPEFMSPEQLLGDPVDARSDIYSLGCILFIMLTGQPAFSAKSREQMIKRRLSEPPPHPNVLVPELHSTFDALVVRLLERAPAARFASTSEVRDALSHTVTNTTTTPPAPYRPTPRSVPTLSMDEIGERDVPSPRRGWPLDGRATIGIGAGVLVIAFVALLARSRATPAPVATVDSTHTAAAESLMASTATKPPDSLAAKKPVVLPSAVPVRGVASASTADSAQQPVSREARDLIQIHHVIDRYRAAFESSDIAKVLAAYPALPAKQQQFWSDNVFALADGIHATVDYTKNQVTGEAADVDFTMRLRFTYKKGRTPGSITLPYHASLAKEGGVWGLKELRQQ